MFLNFSSIFKFHFSKSVYNLKYIFKLVYFRIFYHLPQVFFYEETIKNILEGGLSISRFGDGEMRLIEGESIEFQNYNPHLASRLLDVIHAQHDRLIVGIPDVFNGLSSYKKNAVYAWRKHLSRYLNSWVKYTNPNVIYGNSFISRPYIIYKDSANSTHKFDKIKKLWEGRDILLVEGQKSRLGVGNKLFSNSNSVQRILCPIKNAFGCYDEILDSIKEKSKSKLILLALGPTASVLALDLTVFGFQALDIGHIDIEYEWFLQKAEWTERVQNKYVNEAISGEPMNDFFDEIYQSQICKIISDK